MNTPDTEWKDWGFEEDLRLRVNFDKNQDREVCILFIRRLLSSRDTYWDKHEQKMYEEVERAHKGLLEERDTYWKKRKDEESYNRGYADAEHDVVERVRNYCKKQIAIQDHFLTEYEYAPFEWHKGRKIEAEETLAFITNEDNLK